MKTFEQLVVEVLRQGHDHIQIFPPDEQGVGWIEGEDCFGNGIHVYWFKGRHQKEDFGMVHGSPTHKTYFDYFETLVQNGLISR